MRLRIIRHTHQVIQADAEKFGDLDFDIVRRLALVVFVGGDGVMIHVEDLAQLLLRQAPVLAQFIQPFANHAVHHRFHIQFMDPYPSIPPWILL